jgi:hypothetical protein
MSDDIADEVNILDPSPFDEHDEWEQTIKDDGTLKPVNERYRIRQSALDYPRLWCGTCNVAVVTDPEITYLLSVFLTAAKTHEVEVHS